MEDGAFVKFTAEVPAQKIPGSFARYSRILNQDGKTVAWYKDTYGPAGEFVHRRFEVPGPPRYVDANGNVRFK